MDEDRVVELLEDLVKWTKITNYSQVKTPLDEFNSLKFYLDFGTGYIKYQNIYYQIDFVYGD